MKSVSMKTKGFAALEILLGLLILAILAGGVWVWKEQESSVLQPGSTITPTTATTENARYYDYPWVTHKLLDQSGGSVLGTTYKLPENVAEPQCVDPNCNYRQTKLPVGGSTLIIMPVGKGMPIDYTWETLKAQITDIDGFSRLSEEKQHGESAGTRFMNMPTPPFYDTISFIGQLSSENREVVNLQADLQGVLQGRLAQINSNISLEFLIVHKQVGENPSREGPSPEELRVLTDIAVFGQAFMSFEVERPYKTPSDLITAFENANIRHNSDAAHFILSLFVEPTSQEDKEQLEFLQGKDLPYPPRLFNAAGAGGLKQVLSYTIKESVPTGNITKVLVDEEVKISNNTGLAPVEKTQEYTFELIPDDVLGWKVLRYYPSGSPGTFAGFQ